MHLKVRALHKHDWEKTEQQFNYDKLKRQSGELAEIGTEYQPKAC